MTLQTLAKSIAYDLMKEDPLFSDKNRKSSELDAFSSTIHDYLIMLCEDFFINPANLDEEEKQILRQQAMRDYATT